MNAPSCESKKRLLWLDALKGYAIILVVISHARCVWPHLSILTACYMPLFFVASGYTFRLREGALGRKCRQLLIPYFGWSLFYLLFSAWLRPMNFDEILTKCGGVMYSRLSLFPLTPDNKIRLFAQDASPLWFLTCMVLSYVFSLPLLKAEGRKLWCLITVYTGASVALMYVPILLPWSLDMAFCGALFILCGYHLKSVVLKWKGCLSFLLFGGLLYMWLADTNGLVNMSVRKYGEHGFLSVFLFIIIGILGTSVYGCFFWLAERNRISAGVCAFLAYFGRITMTVMCAHLFFIRIYHLIQINIAKMGFVYSSKLMCIAFVLLGCVLTDKLFVCIRNGMSRGVS